METEKTVCFTRPPLLRGHEFGSIMRHKQVAVSLSAQNYVDVAIQGNLIGNKFSELFKCCLAHFCQF